MDISEYKNEIVVGVIALGCGLGVGYFLGKSNKQPTYQVIPAQPKTDSEPEDEELVSEAGKEAVAAFLKEKREVITTEVVIPAGDNEEPVQVNIFVNPEEEWDFEKELAQRTEDAPYILHRDEFYAEEKGYHQQTLTYYAGDDIMVDEDEAPVYNYRETVGDLKFGHGSGDPNVFHVRNDKRRAEYEIIHTDGLYSVEVLGLEIEPNDRVKGLKHSGVPKFRDD